MDRYLGIPPLVRRLVHWTKHGLKVSHRSGATVRASTTCDDQGVVFLVTVQPSDWTRSAGESRRPDESEYSAPGTVDCVLDTSWSTTVWSKPGASALPRVWRSGPAATEHGSAMELVAGLAGNRFFFGFHGHFPPRIVYSVFIYIYVRTKTEKGNPNSRRFRPIAPHVPHGQRFATFFGGGPSWCREMARDAIGPPGVGSLGRPVIQTVIGNPVLLQPPLSCGLVLRKGVNVLPHTARLCSPPRRRIIEVARRCSSW